MIDIRKQVPTALILKLLWVLTLKTQEYIYIYVQCTYIWYICNISSHIICVALFTTLRFNISFRGNSRTYWWKTLLVQQQNTYIIQHLHHIPSKVKGVHKKKMRSPKIIGTILTPLEWSYSFHMKTRKNCLKHHKHFCIYT